MRSAAPTSAPSEPKMLISAAAKNEPTLQRVAGHVVRLLEAGEQTVIYGRTESHLADRRYCAPTAAFFTHATEAQDTPS